VAAMKGAVLLLRATAVLAFGALADGLGDGASCQQPIAPVFSAPLSTGRRAGARAVNLTHGEYVLLTAPSYETAQDLLRPATDRADSWSGEETELLAEPVPAQDWTVLVYCQTAPDVVLGSIKLRARVDAEVVPQQPWEAAAALDSGALVATDDSFVHLFGWNDIVPCLPQVVCSAVRPAHYYEKETHISKFIALVAVGTIALTSVTFICLTVLRQPCWSESTYDDHYWESKIDLEKLEASHHLSPRSVKPVGADTSSVHTGTEGRSRYNPASEHVIKRTRDPPDAQEVTQTLSMATSPASAVGFSSSAAADAVVCHDALRVDVSDGHSSDDSVESFDSARDALTITHSRMI
jgi:hypothetical protein